MAINNLNLSFNDFRLNEIIDPEQFDVNNAQIVNKINELIGRVNQGFTIGDIGVGAITGNNIAADSIGEDKLTQGVRDKLNAAVAPKIVDAEKIRGINVIPLFPQTTDDGKVLTYDAATLSFVLKSKASGGAGTFYSPSIRGVEKWGATATTGYSVAQFGGSFILFPTSYTTSTIPKV